MGGFESNEIPDWVREGFDARTTLPRGPLEDFPIPLEGLITGAQSLVPKGGDPARYVVSAACGESVAETMRFFAEYLPLAGYIVVGEGSIRARRSFLVRGRRPSVELLVLRKPPFIGTLTVRPPDDDHQGTRIDVDMAHCHHPSMSDVADMAALQRNPDIDWRRFSA